MKNFRTLSLPAAAMLLWLVPAASCREALADHRPLSTTPALLSDAVDHVTDVMVGSVTSPVIASRTYAYSSIAAYEALRTAQPEYRSVAGQLRGLTPVPAPSKSETQFLPLASVVAYLDVAQALVFAPEKVAAYRKEVIDRVRKTDVPEQDIDRSVAYGAQVAKHILAWAATDSLKRARAMPRFEVRNEPGRWQPTPPAYMDAVEPNWRVVRPFVLDSASQFKPPAPAPFDLREGSAFRKEVMATYEAGRNLTDEQRAIAAFWDCNPYALKAQGHIMYAVKKISPGGHWMGITGIALDKSNADAMRAAEAYLRVSVTLMDAFISVWDEKFRSEVIRPETVINDTIDRAWRPLLQTPPFPEYPSGHSVVSTAVAETLTSLFGDDFAFADDVETRFGLPVRNFSSFRQAAEEAAISRLYGGIHYPMAIENGMVQGRALGTFIVARVQTRASAASPTTYSVAPR